MWLAEGALRDGPGLEDAVDLETQVVMEGGGAVLLDEEGERGVVVAEVAEALGLRRALEVAHLLVGPQWGLADLRVCGCRLCLRGVGFALLT